MTLEITRKAEESTYLINYETMEVIRVGCSNFRGEASLFFDAPPNYLIMRSDISVGIIRPCSPCAGSGRGARGETCQYCFGSRFEVDEAELESYIDAHGFRRRLTAGS